MFLGTNMPRETSCPTPNNPLVWNCVTSDYLTGTVGMEAKCFTFANPADSGTPTNQVPAGGFISTEDCLIETMNQGADCHSFQIQIGVDTFDVLLSLYTNIGDFALILEAGQTACPPGGRL